MTLSGGNSSSSELQQVDLSYDKKTSEESARQLVYSIQPKWREDSEYIDIVRFTAGITNELLKLARKKPGVSQTEVDKDSILMRAYGNNTEILIDRDREAASHALCAERGLAPPLLARFRNGLLYRFIPGEVCTPENLTQERVWRAIARRLGEWHCRLPVDAVTSEPGILNNANEGHVNGEPPAQSVGGLSEHAQRIAARRRAPNIWLVMQRWVDALPRSTDAQKSRKNMIQKELSRSFEELDNEIGPGKEGLVFGHCDLLSANVIMLPEDSTSSVPEKDLDVAFIDYEYATPCTAAFDLANHFAEWGGYDCDYNMLPTRGIRREFLREYLSSYNAHSDKPLHDSMLKTLESEVDRYRGMPGMYWGIWALIQATISQIDFNYASYAEERLGEYWNWRAEESGHRAKEGTEMPLRERRWAEQ